MVVSLKRKLPADARMLRWFAALPLLCLAAVLGCGGPPATLQGRLLVDGQPVPEGTIAFRHKESGAVARASVQEDGSYMATSGASGGLEPGEYEISVAAVKGIPDPAAPEKVERWTPMRYSQYDTSGLTVTVEPGKNTHDIECAGE